MAQARFLCGLFVGRANAGDASTRAVGRIGFLNIGNDPGQQVLQPAANKEAEF
jgi:hypothetical protein